MSEPTTAGHTPRPMRPRDAVVLQRHAREVEAAIEAANADDAELALRWLVASLQHVEREIVHSDPRDCEPEQQFAVGLRALHFRLVQSRLLVRS